MADLQPTFNVLEDSATGGGLPLHKLLEGEAVASKNAHGAFVAKDGSGNAKYLEVNAEGSLKVVVDPAGDVACLSDEGGVTGTTSFQDVATITLTDGAYYSKLGVLGSCFKEAVIEAYWVDDVGGTETETILATFRVGAGQFSFSEVFECVSFTAGTTAELRVRAKNAFTGKLSDIDCLVSIEEIQA